jgi:hypothetical protein
MSSFPPTIDPRYHYAMSQVFSAALLKRLDDEAHEEGIRSLLIHSGLYPESEQWSLSRALTLLYTYLQGNYRCEYVYKNEIANQLLLRYHSDNSATLLKEVSSDQSIADIVIINGHTVAYEIKTELDNFDRLSGQLTSYQSLYDYLYVVTHREAVGTIQQKVPDNVGIIILDEQAQLVTVRKAKPMVTRFNPAKAVLTIRQVELVAAYEKWVGPFPKMGTALIYTYCHNWYMSLDSEDARIVFAQALKSRRPSTCQFSLIKDCDSSIRMLLMGRDLTKKHCVAVREKLGILA